MTLPPTIRGSSGRRFVTMQARGASRLTSPVTPLSGHHGSTVLCRAVGVLIIHHRTHSLARQVEELLAKLGSVGPFRQSHAVPGKILEFLCC
jgi:hypothetical protein